MTAAFAHGNLQIGADGFRMLPRISEMFPSVAGKRDPAAPALKAMATTLLLRGKFR
jgi:hypothetical protein